MSDMHGINIRRIVFPVIIVLLILFSILLTTEHRNTISQIENEKIKSVEKELEAIVAGYRVVSLSIFENVINRPDIAGIIYRASFSAGIEEKKRLRKRLGRILNVHYGHMRGYNFRQLHFHLADNTSFYRFHKPSRWGDDLTDVRATVRHVNNTGEFAQGFEEGRIINGYRYVYPLEYNGEHAGSVEVSISMKAVVEILRKLYGRDIQFLLSSRVVAEKVFASEQDNYIRWALTDEYVFDHELPGTGFPEEKLTGSEKKKILSKISQEKLSTFIVHTKNNEDLVFLSISNFEGRPVAFLVNQVDNSAYRSTRTNYTVNIALLGVLVLLLLYLAYKTSTTQRQLEQLVDYDTLTGAYSRNTFLVRLNEDFERFCRYSTPLSLVYMDLDYFKEINDRYGHAAGDRVLKEFTEIVKSRIRATDYVGRIGGDEFLLALPGTSVEGGSAVAHTIHEQLQTATGDSGIEIKCSFGVGEVRPDDRDMDKFIERIDNELYKSKKSGRNHVTVVR